MALKTFTLSNLKHFKSKNKVIFIFYRIEKVKIFNFFYSLKKQTLLK